MSPLAGQPIRAALDAIATHLESGDRKGAAQAIESLNAACQANVGVQLDAATLADLRARVERCHYLAARNHDDLTTTLLMFGTSRRANRAYRRVGK